MSMERGTPKSLKEAIFNAFEDNKIIVSDKLMNDIITNLRDFMSQKFQLFWDIEQIGEYDSFPVRKLWEKIVGK